MPEFMLEADRAATDFTFYLNDPILGDAFQQRDSRLGEGGSVQYPRPHTTDWGVGVLTVGGGFQGSQNIVDLRHRIDRDPVSLFTSVHANPGYGLSRAVGMTVRLGWK